MDQDRSFLPRWLVGAVCTALPVAWVLARNGTDGPLAPILLTALGLVVAFGVIAPVDASERAVAGSFNGERIVGRSWPTAGNHVVFLELHD